MFITVLYRTYFQIKYPTLICCLAFLFSLLCVLPTLFSVSFLAATQMAVVADAELKGRNNTCLYSYPLPLVPAAPKALYDRSQL